MLIKLLTARVDGGRRLWERGETIDVPAAEALLLFRRGQAERVQAPTSQEATPKGPAARVNGRHG
jgi:hypothetical protein